MHALATQKLDSLFNTEKFFLPYTTLGLKFIPYMTLPSVPLDSSVRIVSLGPKYPSLSKELTQSSWSLIPCTCTRGVLTAPIVHRFDLLEVTNLSPSPAATFHRPSLRPPYPHRRRPKWSAVLALIPSCHVTVGWGGGDERNSGAQI